MLIVILIVFILYINSNRNCNKTLKTQLLQTITFIKRYKNQSPNSKHQTLLSPKKTLTVLLDDCINRHTYTNNVFKNDDQIRLLVMRL